MEFLKKIYFSLFEFNKNILPAIDNPSANKAYINVVCAIEIILFALIAILIIRWFIKQLILSSSGTKKNKIVNYSGGFRRRFERVVTNVPVEYRLDKDGEYSKGVCKDISFHGMKLEINDTNPQLHQRVEIVLDGKKMRLPSKDRIKVGGFIVRVVKKKNKVFDVGIEFYHLFKNQLELIESLMEKKR